MDLELDLTQHRYLENHMNGQNIQDFTLRNFKMKCAKLPIPTTFLKDANRSVLASTLWLGAVLRLFGLVPAGI